MTSDEGVLVGPNGACKTTLQLMLATLLAPDSGELRVAGFDPVTDTAAVRGRLGWSAPAPPLRFDPVSERWELATELDPLSVVGQGVRSTRIDPANDDEFTRNPKAAPAVWPSGLVFDVLLGAGAIWVSARRLRTPARNLARRSPDRLSVHFGGCRAVEGPEA
jgi:energy-coupling factor transporter ATP-binding protein EcfA2